MYYLQRVNSFSLVDNPAISPETVLDICTRNGSAVCGYGQALGELAAGKKADLILVNPREIEAGPLVRRGCVLCAPVCPPGPGRMVDTVMIGGQLVMQDRKILTLDEESLYRQVREEAAFGQTEEQKAYARLMDRIRPYYLERYNRWLQDVTWDPYFIMNSRT